VLRLLAEHNGDFTAFPAEGGGNDQSSGTQPLDAAAAAAYLSDPLVWHWVAERVDMVVGFLMCLVQRRRHGTPLQVLLYDLGVRAAYRRQGVATGLIAELVHEMARQGIDKAWVLADNPVAVSAYERSGFVRRDSHDVHLVLALDDPGQEAR